MAARAFHKSQFLRRAVCIFSCLLIQPCCPGLSAKASESALSPDAATTADILGIGREAEQIISLRAQASSESQRHQLNNYRSLALRRIFEAILQLQAAESQLEFEINYASDAIDREQRQENTVNQILNVANFTQGGTFATIGTVADMRQQFVLESTLGVVSAGIGTLLPILGILYSKLARACDLAPPEFMSAYLNGKPVDGATLPPLVVRYLNSPAPGESRTRKDVLNSLWKKRFKADMANKKTLLGIDDGKARSQSYLNNRLLLLWSLYTAIEDFDTDLLSLLKQLRGDLNIEQPLSNTRIGSTAAEDAARLLHLEPVLDELNALNVSGQKSERKRELQITLLETLLSGSLEMSVAGDKCQKELNYQYDVVLEQLKDRRSSFMQKIYEANFIQGGSFGAIASSLFLKKQLIPAGRVLLVSGGIGLSLTGISYLAMHGGWRKNETGPNSLADFFNLRADHGFSPLVYAYLNSASPKRVDGKSRRQCLEEYWTNNDFVTVDLKNGRVLEKLASMPSCKRDTIKLVVNRIALLSSLREQYNEFDLELLDLLRKAWQATPYKGSTELDAELSPSVMATAKLLGVQSLPASKQQSDETDKLLITRQVLDAFLSTSFDTNVICQEVDHEFKVMDRMERERDKVIELTNNANFLQSGILGLVASSLGLTGRPADVLATNRISLVTAALSSGLAGVSMLEQRGGWRPDKVRANGLGAAFGKDYKFSPVTIRYLNAVAPEAPMNLTRREILTKYWQESKVLSVNIKKDSVLQKLTAEGKAHSRWSESIHLINNRITMLFDLKAVIQSSNLGFAELLKAID